MEGGGGGGGAVSSTVESHFPKALMSDPPHFLIKNKLYDHCKYMQTKLTHTY